MKRFTESKLGLEYLWEVIEQAEDAGVQCIVDDNTGKIYLYDPADKAWATSQTLENMRIDVLEFLMDWNEYGQAWLDCRDPEFKDFAVAWDGLQKKDDSENVFKTKRCELIRVDSRDAVNESSDWLDMGLADWYMTRFPDDAGFAERMDSSSTFQELWEALEVGDDVYSVIGVGDSTVRERLFQRLAALKKMSYGEIYRMWQKSGKRPMRESYGDERRDWSANEDEVEIHWLIDDPEMGIAIDTTERFVIDLDDVNDFQDLIDEVNHQLAIHYGGMGFEYDEDWTFVDEDELMERFGYSMDESGSNGGTIDVTLKFTNGHYGKKLKAGDERTIKLDTSTAPTIYDQDDMLTWIAEVASDQIPGGGCFTKYSFETIDPPDDVLIKAVKGDEGFGPDVDVDFDDPNSIPSEVSYADALKIYKKMHDAYDDRKLDYNKYDKIRKRLMDAVVKGLLKEKSLDDLADEWFINYGTMNGWGWKTSFKYNVACALHEIHKKKHPDEHVPDRVDTVRGWHEDNCSCGLCSSCDSSD